MKHPHKSHTCRAIVCQHKRQYPQKFPWSGVQRPGIISVYDSYRWAAIRERLAGGNVSLQPAAQFAAGVCKSGVLLHGALTGSECRQLETGKNSIFSLCNPVLIHVLLMEVPLSQIHECSGAFKSCTGHVTRLPSKWQIGFLLPDKHRCSPQICVFHHSREGTP